MLTVKLLFDRWVLLNSSQTLDSPRIVKVSTLSEGCTGEAPSRCLVDKPRTNPTNSDPLDFSDEGGAGNLAPCSADAVSELEENEYRDNQRPVRRLPQYLIIGVQKGGTGALKEFLNLHPDVRTRSKEAHFFDRDDLYRHGLEWYRRQMPVTHAG